MEWSGVGGIKGKEKIKESYIPDYVKVMNMGWFLFSCFWYSAGYKLIEALFSACVPHVSGLTLSAAPRTTTQRPPGPLLGTTLPNDPLLSMEQKPVNAKSCQGTGFLMFSITVLFCTTAALHKKEEDSTSKKHLADLSPCADHWCSHPEQ